MKTRSIKTRTKVATLLIAWLVFIPIATIVPSEQAQAAVIPDEERLELFLEDHADSNDLVFGERLSSRTSAHASARISRGPWLPTDPMLPVPDWTIWPHEDLNQVVNLESFLMVTDGFETKRWCICLWFFTLVFNATPIGTRFEFRETDTGRRTEVDCWGPPLPWIPGMTDAICGKDWEHSSDVTGAVEAKARVIHFVVVTGSWNFFYVAKSRASDTKTLKVGEVLNIGQTISLPVVEAVPGSDSPGFCSKWGINFLCWVGEQIYDAAVEAVLWAAPWLEEVVKFFDGCSDAALDAVGGLAAILEELARAFTDPITFVNEKLQEFKDLVEAVREDPWAFAEEVLGEVLQIDRLDEEGLANWLGSMICTLAIDYFTGKLAASVLMKARRWLRDRRNGPDGPNNPDPNDPDNPTNPCRISSFPGDTLVVMADGSHVRIDEIRPGDWVLSHDLDTSEWIPSLVVDQWSHPDRGPPATAVLDSGASITATNDHLFWQANTGRWVELQHFRSGDELRTPTGDVSVATVTVGPRHLWTVWELTVVDTHNFTVIAGDEPVLVHNAAGCQPSPAELRRRSQDTADRLKRDGLDVTPEEVAEAWERYLERNPDADFDTWQEQYERIRRNNHLGNAYEADLLREKYGIETKNGRTYTDPNSGTEFKPDAVISENPPHFVEVKDYQNTTLYPGSNAGKQLEYLIDQANSGNPGRLDLYITDPDNISPGMQDLIDEAREAGVTVNINPENPTGQ